MRRIRAGGGRNSQANVSASGVGTSGMRSGGKGECKITKIEVRLKSHPFSLIRASYCTTVHLEESQEMAGDHCVVYVCVYDDDPFIVLTGKKFRICMYRYMYTHTHTHTHTHMCRCAGPLRFSCSPQKLLCVPSQSICWRGGGEAPLRCDRSPTERGEETRRQHGGNTAETRRKQCGNKAEPSA